jgi:hypothetical protein
MSDRACSSDADTGTSGFPASHLRVSFLRGISLALFMSRGTKAGRLKRSFPKKDQARPEWPQREEVMGKDREMNRLQVEDLEDRVAPLLVAPTDTEPSQPAPSSVDTSYTSDGSGGLHGKTVKK